MQSGSHGQGGWYRSAPGSQSKETVEETSANYI